MRKVTKVLAYLMALLMAISTPLNVLAQESDTVSGNVEIIESVEFDETVSDNEDDVAEDVETVSDNEVIVDEENTVSDNEEVTVSDNEELEVEEVVFDNMGMTVSANATEISEEVEAKENSEAFGFSGMKLTETMLEQKAEIAAIVASLEDAVAGEDYVDGVMLFFANSEEEAKEIAAAYNTDNVFYQDGVGMIQLPYATVDVLTLAADMSNNLPALYPNIIYTASELGAVELDVVDTDKSESVKQKATEKVSAEKETLEYRLEEQKKISKEAQESAIEVEKENVLVESDKVHTEALAPLSSIQYADDVDYGKQWHHDVVGTETAWNLGITGEGVKVAVIDSGIDSDHPDLKENIAAVESTVYKTNILGWPVDEDGNLVEYVEDLVFLSGEDENGHGTHVAGIIAADDNTIGGVGVAPDAEIYSIRALNAKGSGSSLMIYLALQKALELNVDVVNMSLGSHVYDYTQASAIKKLIDNGIVVVAAAGNEGYYLYDQKSYPAAYPSVISVAATYSVNGYQDLAWFSTFGDWVTIAAPGGYAQGSVYNFIGYDTNDIYSTYLNGSYAFMAGTSQASPVTAGTVALVLQSRKNEMDNIKGKKKVDKVRNILLSTEKEEGYYSEYGYVYGGLNTADAIISSIDLDAPTMTPSTVIDGTKVKQPTIAAGDNEYITVSSTSSNAIIYVTSNGKNPSDSCWQYAGYGSVKVPANKSGNMTIKATVVFGDKKASTTQKYKLVAKAQGIEAKNGTEQQIVIGGSVKMAVNFYPLYTTDKKMEWTSSDQTKFSVNKTNGTVKCTKKAQVGDTAIITGTLKADPAKVVTIKVTAINKADVSVELKDQKETLTLATYVTDQGYVDYYDLSADVTAKNCDVTYISSNKKVAIVDEFTGVIIPVGKGSCKITATATDGSKKKVVKKVTVVNPVSSIGVDNLVDGSWGFSSYGYTGELLVNVAKGSSIKMKTYISGYYDGAMNNKKINWTTTDENVKFKGNKLVCGKNATVSSKYVTVTGTAADGSGVKIVLKVRVWDKAKAIGWQNGSNTIQKSKIVTITHGYDESYKEPVFFYSAEEADIYRGGTMIFSNPDVCYLDVDNYGNVILVGAKKGKCTITYKALDGSNLSCKYVITVK